MRQYTAVQDARARVHLTLLGLAATYRLHQSFDLALHHAEQAVRGLRAVIFHGLVGHQHCCSRVVELGVVLGLGSTVRNEHRCALTSSTLSFSCLGTVLTVSAGCVAPGRRIQHRGTVAGNWWTLFWTRQLLAGAGAPSVSISAIGAPSAVTECSTWKNRTLCNHGAGHLGFGWLQFAAWQPLRTSMPGGAAV